MKGFPTAEELGADGGCELEGNGFTLGELDPVTGAPSLIPTDDPL